jgi:hypothetical protein
MAATFDDDESGVAATDGLLHSSLMAASISAGEAGSQFTGDYFIKGVDDEPTKRQMEHLRAVYKPPSDTFVPFITRQKRASTHGVSVPELVTHEAKKAKDEEDAMDAVSGKLSAVSVADEEEEKLDTATRFKCDGCHGVYLNDKKVVCSVCGKVPFCGTYCKKRFAGAHGCIV